MKNDNLLKSRFEELSRRAYQKDYTTYSEFLNLDEISILKSTLSEGDYFLYGGYESAERCVAAFGNELPEKYPIACIEICPVMQKFADDLTHRDFLGSLMNLGIERSLLGDIKINNNSGYLFCLNKIAQYISDNLTKVRHTTVRCRILDEYPEFINEAPLQCQIIISSARLDAVISAVYRLSRGKASVLINQEKVYINSRISTKEGTQLKCNDIISVRGHGKFIFESISHETKKGRLVAVVRIYR